jgi:hypothetical protein
MQGKLMNERGEFRKYAINPDPILFNFETRAASREYETTAEDEEN